MRVSNRAVERDKPLRHSSVAQTTFAAIITPTVDAASVAVFAPTPEYR